MPASAVAVIRSAMQRAAAAAFALVGPYFSPIDISHRMAHCQIHVSSSRGVPLGQKMVSWKAASSPMTLPTRRPAALSALSALSQFALLLLLQAQGARGPAAQACKGAGGK